MNTNTETPLAKTYALKEACLNACRKAAAQISRFKAAVLEEFQTNLELPEHLLRLAINEAEALAYQTAYPQLVFPDLAAEKAQNLATWQGNQRAINRNLGAR